MEKNVTMNEEMVKREKNCLPLNMPKKMPPYGNVFISLLPMQALAIVFTIVV